MVSAFRASRKPLKLILRQRWNDPIVSTGHRSYRNHDSNHPPWHRPRLNIRSIFQLQLCLELSRCLRELSFRCLGTMGFVTAFEGHVLHAESHADLLQEVVRRSSPNKDESVVVRNFPYLARNFKEHGVLPDFDGHGIEQDGYFPAMHAFFDALGIAFFDAAKLLFAVRECNL